MRGPIKLPLNTGGEKMLQRDTDLPRPPVWTLPGPAAQPVLHFILCCPHTVSPSQLLFKGPTLINRQYYKATTGG